MQDPDTSVDLPSDALSEVRPKRKKITQEQFEHLASIFEQSQTPGFDLRESAGAQIGMTNREVQVW